MCSFFKEEEINMEIFTEELMLPLFEVLEACKGVTQKAEWHPEGDVFVHSLQTLQWAFRESEDIDLIIAAMMHDVGKQVNSLGHEKGSVALIKDHISAKTEWLILNHMRVWSFILGDMKKLSKVKEMAKHPWLGDALFLGRWGKLGRNSKKKVMYDRQYILDRLNNIVIKRFNL